MPLCPAAPPPRFTFTVDLHQHALLLLAMLGLGGATPVAQAQPVDATIPPADMLAHRVLWSAVFVWVLLAFFGFGVSEICEESFGNFKCPLSIVAESLGGH